MENSVTDNSAIEINEQSPQILIPALYVVATPLGNLRDITLRALDVLKASDMVFAEDTRVVQKLLQAYGIDKKLVRCDAYQEAERAQQVIEHAKQGKKIVFVSDAGTPAISDPGAGLVARCVEAGITVIPIPGACAVTTALSVSGIEQTSFLFLGFLPTGSAARRSTLQEHAQISSTLVLYESARRVHELLEDINVVLGARPIVIARELTKKFETIYRGTAATLKPIALQPDFKGEVVVMIDHVSGDDPLGLSEADILQQLNNHMRTHSLKEAVAVVTAQTGLPRKTIYALALQVTRDKSD